MIRSTSSFLWMNRGRVRENAVLLGSEFLGSESAAFSRAQPRRSWFRLVPLVLLCLAQGLTASEPQSPGYTIPLVDISSETDRQVVVDREPGQYLGHPTAVLLEDGHTMLCVYPRGHGRGAIVLKRSADGGRTGSERLPVPDNWATSLETPTLHRVVDAQGKKRLILWSGLWPARLAVSEDDGVTWTPLRAAGDWGGIVVMSSLEARRDRPGCYLSLFHDDGRFIRAEAKQEKPVVFRLYQTELPDGTFVSTTYGHWTQGQAPYIVGVRFTLAELDAKLETGVIHR